MPSVEIDHRRRALYGSASVFALAAMPAVGVVMVPGRAAALPLSPAGCTESSSGSGNWFCDNDGGGEQGGDIDGNDENNTIEIIGGSYTLGDYPSTDVNGNGGNDTITIRPDPDADGESSIAIDGSISGGEGDDTITVGGGALSEYDFGWVNINGDVRGDEGDDTINITASDEMLTGINKVGDDGGNVLGGAGDDEINVTNASLQDITIEGSVMGGADSDGINVAATEGAEIVIKENVFGGDGLSGEDGDDTIDIVAGSDELGNESAGSIAINGIIGGDAGDDDITVIAQSGGTVTLGTTDLIDGDTGGDVLGGAGTDDIRLFADGAGSKVTLYGDIDGGLGDDSIQLVGDDGGQVSGKHIDGDDGKDFIGLFADNGGSVAVEDIRGGDGDDIIVLGAVDDGTVEFDAINGDSSGPPTALGLGPISNNDIIVLAAIDGGEVTGRFIDGDKGDDIIGLLAYDHGTVDVEYDISGDDGDDIIVLGAVSHSAVEFGNIHGDEGHPIGALPPEPVTNDDIIVLAAIVDSEVHGTSIEGNQGDDFIGLFAVDHSEVTLDEDVDGGTGEDIIVLGAALHSTVEVRDVLGDADDDVIVLAAIDGKVKAHDVKGGTGNDIIVLGAALDGKVKAHDVEGNDGDDVIVLAAALGGKVKVGDVKGGDGDDVIVLGAIDGKVKADNIMGGDGDDIIVVGAALDGKTTFHDIDGDADDAPDAAPVTHDDIIILGAALDGKVKGGDVRGNEGDDIIGLISVLDGQIKVDDIEGNDGDDIIALGAALDGRIRFGDIEGGWGDDIIVVGAALDGYVRGGDIEGGWGNDVIALVSALDGDIKVGDIRGEEGDDIIVVAATLGGDIRLDDIAGDGSPPKTYAPETNDDVIIVGATLGGDVHGNNIDGDEGDDTIALVAETGGDVRVEDVDGSDGDDIIVAGAATGGDIRVDDVKGGYGDDVIALVAAGGSIAFGNIHGDNGDGPPKAYAPAPEDFDDEIVLAATLGGSITGNDVNGDEGHDDIVLLADGGSISIDDIDGGDGDDDIFVGATSEGSLISLDNIRGGDGDDLVILSGLDNMNSNFAISGAVDGGDGFDTLIVEGASTLSLDDVQHFQQLGVSETSYLELTQRYSNVIGRDGMDGLVVVDPTSYLRLSDSDADLDTGTFVLEGSDGEAGYRSIFTGTDGGVLTNTGGVLDVSGNTLTGVAYTQVELSDTDGSEPSEDLPDATFINQGTIALHSGLVDDLGHLTDIAGDRFTINGDYVGGGNLLLDTYVYNAASPTDVLAINGNVAPDATTTIYINNTNGGQGTLTGQGAGDGIKVVDVAEYAESPDDGFQLARNQVSGQREIMVGAYSYRLFQDPANEMLSKSVEDTGAGDWYLRSNYTSQAAGYATAPSAMQRHFYAGMDTLYKRLGEMRQQEQLEGRNADLEMPTKAQAFQPVPAPKFQMWGRGGGSDLSYDVSSGWDFSQQTWGLQAGGDYTFDYNNWRVTAGAFGGYGWSDVDVDGAWNTWYGNSTMSIDGWSAGVYASIREVGLTPGAGFYTDMVGKVDVLDLDIASSSNVSASTDATVWGGSIEMGYGFELANGWVIQPQAQLAYASANQDAYFDSVGTYVSPGDAESLIGRLGVQVQSTFIMSTGQSITPYATFSVQSEFMGDNTTNVAGTVLTSDINGTWYNAGLGFTANLNESVALFGSAEYNFGDVEGWAGLGGVKVRW